MENCKSGLMKAGFCNQFHPNDTGFPQTIMHIVVNE